MTSAGSAAINSRVAPPFVGRSHELDDLAAGLAEVRQGRGQLFLLSGEPGIGKTRMADELCAIAPPGMRVAWGRCQEYGDAIPYWPWREVVRACAGDLPRDKDSDLLALLRAADRTGNPGEVARLFGPDESDLNRFALFESTAALLKRMAVPGGLTIVLDDLHAADDASLELLRFVAHGLRGASILVIGTYRDAEVRTTPRLSRIFGELSRDAQTIMLHGLSRDDVGEFVRSSAGRNLDDAAVEQLYLTTGGNPFFVGETLKLWVAEESLSSAGKIRTARIPDSIRSTIRRRLDLLPPHVHEPLHIAAVIGVEFGFKVLQRVTQIEPEALRDLLGRAVAAGILTEDGTSRGVYRFAHSLMAQTIYRDLPPGERARLHHRIADSIEQLYSANLDPHLAEIARHYTEANSPDTSLRTIDYLRRAARLALDSLAYEESVNLYETALRLGHDNDLMTPALHYELLIDSGEAFYAAGLVSQARRAFERAGEIARSLGDGQKLARAALGRATPPSDIELDRPLVMVLEEALRTTGDIDPATRAKMLVRLGSELQWSADPRAAAFASEAVDLATKCGEPLTLIYVRYWRDLAMWSVDNLEERLSNIAEAVELAEKIDNRPWALKTHYVRYLSALENCDIRRADAAFARFSELTDQLRLPFGWKQMALAERALMDGRLDDAEKFSLTSLEIGRRMESRFRTLRQAFNNLSLILRREQGRIAEVEPVFRAAVVRHPESFLARCSLALCCAEMDQRREVEHLFEFIANNDLQRLPRNQAWYAVMVLLSEASVYLADTERGQLLYRLLAPFAGRNALLDVHVCYGPVDRYLGKLATIMSRFDDAETHFKAAIALCSRMGSRLWLARTLLDYATMLARGPASGRAAAHRHLDAVIEDAAALRLKTIGEQARALQAGLGISSKRVSSVAVPAKAEGSNVFRREGETWEIAWRGSSSRFKDSKGLGYIAHLLRYSGQQFHVIDMINPGAFDVTEDDDSAEARRPPEREGYQALALGDAGAMLDPQAKAQYKRRLEELREELEEARHFNNESRAQKAEDEIDAITRELSRAVGLSGRNRLAASATERARVNVTRAIKAAIERIRLQNPDLATNLERKIRTGTFCCYSPDAAEADESWEI